jgi:nuclear GTP-binding protein
MHVYSVPTFESADDFLRLVAAQRGKLKKGGVPNTAEAGRIVLKDWRNGTIPYYTLPPKKHFDELPYEDAQVVQSYSAEFSAEDVYRNEGTLVIDKLPTKSERADSQLMAQMSAGSKPTLDVDNLEQQVQAEQAVGEHQTRFRTNTSRANASDNDEQTQSELLYTESGQYNPHLARAAKKRTKKARAAGAVQSNVTSVDEEPDEDMEEYDFGALGGGRRDEDEDGNVIVVDESNDDGADKSDEELDGDEEADDEQMG